MGQAAVAAHQRQPEGCIDLGGSLELDAEVPAGRLLRHGHLSYVRPIGSAMPRTLKRADVGDRGYDQGGGDRTDAGDRT